MKVKKFEEVFNRTQEANKRVANRSDFEGRSYHNVMFISSNPDKANEIIKDYLEKDFGANVITVTPNGYEISKEKANIQVGCVNMTAICPGDEMTDKLKQENVILFLPNLDKMEDKNYRRSLLNMAREHIVADSRNGEDGFSELDGSFFAVATVGHMYGNEMYELATMDAKDSFRCVNLDEIMAAEDFEKQKEELSPQAITVIRRHKDELNKDIDDVSFLPLFIDALQTGGLKLFDEIRYALEYAGIDVKGENL